MSAAHQKVSKLTAFPSPKKARRRRENQLILRPSVGNCTAALIATPSLLRKRRMDYAVITKGISTASPARPALTTGGNDGCACPSYGLTAGQGALPVLYQYPFQQRHHLHHDKQQQRQQRTHFYHGCFDYVTNELYTSNKQGGLS